jgi:hypothetical protein
VQIPMIFENCVFLKTQFSYRVAELAELPFGLILNVIFNTLVPRRGAPGNVGSVMLVPQVWPTFERRRRACKCKQTYCPLEFGHQQRIRKICNKGAQKIAHLMN